MEHNNKVTSKDFFLYLGMLITLYWSTIALLVFLFNLINIALPDSIDAYTVQSYSGSLRFSISSLIIIFPAFLIISYFINRDLVSYHEKRNVWIRKWFIHLTLFLAGLTLAGDLVAIVNVFLNGEITARFILKAVSVFLVAAALFSYYFYDLKYHKQGKNMTARLFAWIVSGIILILLIVGVFLSGSPMKERIVRFDTQRESDLQNISDQIVSYWQEKDHLPDNLGEVNDPLSGNYIPVDPETGDAYVYQKTGDESFSLCATFGLNSNDENTGITDDNWQHEKGQTCFTRTIDPQKYPPLPASPQSANQ